MNNISKGKSPFYPGQPVPIEFFIGRINEVQRISRAISQVELGKPQAIFLTGEYGIGKSSLSGYIVLPCKNFFFQKVFLCHKKLKVSKV